MSPGFIFLASRTTLDIADNYNVMQMYRYRCPHDACPMDLVFDREKKREMAICPKCDCQFETLKSKDKPLSGADRIYPVDSDLRPGSRKRKSA